MLKNIVKVSSSDFVTVKTLPDLSNLKEVKDKVKYNYAKRHQQKPRQRQKVDKWLITEKMYNEI